jgi:mannosyltransferase OCH1-like enzyme
MLLANILLTNGDEAPLPAVVAENMASFQARHPGVPHRLFRRDDILDLLRGSFSADVLGAFNALRPYSYQADLAAFCILHEFGGSYADLSYFFLRPLPMGGERPVVFRDLFWSSPWDASCGCIYAPPSHKALDFAINAICANVRNRYYGATALCPTGPALFGKALATTCEAEELVSGSAVLMRNDRLQPRIRNVSLPEGQNTHCLVLLRRLIAVKRKPMGSNGIAGLGVTNGNSYHDLWKARDVYAVETELQ